MLTVQRSATGCWTCRLRRKKCDENGMPCQNCASRGIHCHGYGPKPSWKDRGEKEKEEARKAKATLKATRGKGKQTIQEQQPLPNSPTPCRPLEQSSHHEDQNHSFISEFPMDFTFESISDFDISSEAFWTVSGSSSDDRQFDFSGSRVQIFPTINTNHNDLKPVPTSLPTPDSANSAKKLTEPIVFNEPLDLCQLNDKDISGAEREASLVVHYVGEVFKIKYPYYCCVCPEPRGWLLLFLTKSIPFYYATLSLSAYHLYSMLAGSVDREIRSRAFQDFQLYRSRANTELRHLQAPNHTQISPMGFQKNTEILSCAIQLLLLQAFSSSEQSWQMHLETAIQAFAALEDLETTSDPLLSENAFSSVSILPGKETSATIMSTTERRVLEVFRCSLVWIDILSCASAGKAPTLTSTYRKLLSGKSSSPINVAKIMDCGNWVILAILDIILLEEWKHQAESEGKLSFRELVMQAQKIESQINEGLKLLGNDTHQNPSKSNIFASAALVYLHAVVSGPRPGVPEIQQSVAKAVSAFERLSKGCDLKSLIWPYCIIGCLAVNEQRDILRNLMASASPESQTLSNLMQVEAILEECWKGAPTREDGSVSRDDCCDWRAGMQRLDLKILLV